MKPSLNLVLSGLLIITLASCNDDDTEQPSQVRPERLEEVGYQRQYIFDAGNRLKKVVVTSVFPDGQKEETDVQYFYNTSGRLESAVSSTGYEMKYTYDDAELLVRTDEFIDSRFSQYHTFVYDSRDRLTETITWQRTGDENWVPYAKTTYSYDINSNLTASLLYSFNLATQKHELSTTFEFSEYDDKLCAENLFDDIAINPLVELRKNNPGKLTTKNRFGNITSTETYQYQFSDMTYPAERTTTTTFYSGSTGSYITKFFYRLK